MNAITEDTRDRWGGVFVATAIIVIAAMNPSGQDLAPRLYVGFFAMMAIVLLSLKARTPELVIEYDKVLLVIHEKRRGKKRAHTFRWRDIVDYEIKREWVPSDDGYAWVISLTVTDAVRAHEYELPPLLSVSLENLRQLFSECICA
jgi:hypothetical protein